MSDRLHTKNGRPLQVHDDKVYSRSGTYVGRISNGKIYDPNGRYAATIVGDRAVYRTTDSASIIGPSISSNRVGIAVINKVGAAIIGDEPPFPD
ncbi:4-fold beta flower protein [Pseudolysinimonas sp.]